MTDFRHDRQRFSVLLSILLPLLLTGVTEALLLCPEGYVIDDNGVAKCVGEHIHTPDTEIQIGWIGTVCFLFAILIPLSWYLWCSNDEYPYCLGQPRKEYKRIDKIEMRLQQLEKSRAIKT